MSNGDNVNNYLKCLQCDACLGYSDEDYMFCSEKCEQHYKQYTSYKIILDLCGGTGAWSYFYQLNGYIVRVITLPEDIRLLKHIKPHTIYGILAAPPCDHFAGSGARWWKEKGEQKLLEGLSVVDACLRVIFLAQPRKFWCLENPVGRLNQFIGNPVTYIQPYYYGDPYTKKTCLWGSFNIPERINEVLPVEGSKLHRLPPSEKRKELRSITPRGFARAFFLANQ